ncbi:MAG TPA: TetR family transcriptional regulator [Baekduia sp.]|uniref:TetR family transcriptional regulator n=1 Tax=Baekduia sp. TaxID=2600305 RepID=UPI002D76C01B|nr:TetR family transcriptional regulator [Baekduia sp.]HET6509972.1 TetR family transcriptional regulator [Baekduia sp.]
MATSGIAKRRAAAKADGSSHYVARRLEIVKRAAEVFKTKGLAATSVDDIAKAAGVDRASLYYYVGSKKELFEEVVIEAVVANIEMAERIRRSDAAPADKLSQLVEGLMASYAEHHPHLYVFVQEDTAHLRGSGTGDRNIGELQKRFDRALIAIIQEGVDSGAFRADVPPRIAAYGIIGMVNWSHRWFDPDGPVGSDEVGRAFASMAVDGLSAHGKPGRAPAAKAKAPAKTAPAKKAPARKAPAKPRARKAA